MSLGIIFVMIQSYLQLRLKYRSVNDLRLKEPQDVQDLRKEIVVWQQAASSLTFYSIDGNVLLETLQKKINHLQYQLKVKLTTGAIPKDVYQQTLQDLQQKVFKAPNIAKNMTNSENICVFPTVFNSK